MRGPAVEKAFDNDGKPTRALEGFLRGNGVTVDDIEKRDTGKGVYVFVQKARETRTTRELLPELLQNTILSIPFPKRMKWSTKSLQFPRPIRYILALYENEVVPFDVDGIEASDETRGHFIQHDGMIRITDTAAYERILEENGVILDQDRRRQMIEEKLKEAAEQNECVLIDDVELLETVTYIVENVNMVVCRFDERFLRIPDIVLIAEMKEHQKYFALRRTDGSLSNAFCVISNNPATDFIREGNERVIAARFSDAEFFFEEDRKRPLADRIDDLKPVLFHKDLGSVYDKVMRIRKISGEFCTMLQCDAETAGRVDRAVMLAKTDLTTAMVFEFTSLQGQIGRIYAELDGEHPSVAAAIDNQYRPRFQGDRVPDDIVSVILSLAEKIDNLFGSYSVGNIPKGSQDPYALRRQGYAVVDLLLRNSLHVDLSLLFDRIKGAYANAGGITEQILEFLTVRAKTRFSEDGILHDEFDAVISTGSYDYCELYNRAMSLHEFRQDGNFSDMLGSFKRMNNIIASFIRKNPDYTFSLNETVLEDDREKKLYEYFASRQNEIEELTRDHRYVPLFEILTEGRPVIDAFFDGVMVMADDDRLRDARLGLLNWIITMFSRFIDFSKLADHSSI